MKCIVNCGVQTGRTLLQAVGRNAFLCCVRFGISPKDDILQLNVASILKRCHNAVDADSLILSSALF